MKCPIRGIRAASKVTESAKDTLSPLEGGFFSYAAYIAYGIGQPSHITLARVMYSYTNITPTQKEVTYNDLSTRQEDVYFRVARNLVELSDVFGRPEVCVATMSYKGEGKDARQIMYHKYIVYDMDDKSIYIPYDGTEFESGGNIYKPAYEAIIIASACLVGIKRGLPARALYVYDLLKGRITITIRHPYEHIRKGVIFGPMDILSRSVIYPNLTYCSFCSEEATCDVRRKFTQDRIH